MLLAIVGIVLAIDIILLGYQQWCVWQDSKRGLFDD